MKYIATYLFISFCIISFGQDIPEKEDVVPEFPGGQDSMYKFIYANLKYPKKAKEKGIEGKVYIQFVVEADGSLSNIKVLKGLGYGCDEEAMRIIKKMPKWVPGGQNGKKVPVKFNLPIKFELKE